MVKGEILVKFKSVVSETERQNIRSKFNWRLKGKIDGIDVECIKLPAGVSVQSAVQSYKTIPEIEYAEPNYIRKAFKIPNDTYYNEIKKEQWGLTKIDAPLAWDKAHGTNTIIVAVIDSGVDYNHPDLSYNIWLSTGYDFIANNDASETGTPLEDNNPMDEHGHGTHVAGIIAAVTNNGTGIAGVAGGWYPQKGVQIMAVRVLNNQGIGTDFTVSKGIKYAADNNAKIINLSLGGLEPSNTLKAAVDYAAFSILKSTVDYAYG
ncbi:MAG: S8 family serine peptidase, partial [Elusimicrobiota bacterium]|nr:S8 family serine peptidase [Elusimicrobiota bacterium]